MLKQLIVPIVMTAFLTSCSQESVNPKASANQQSPKTVVSVVEVQGELISSRLALPGRVSPFRQSNVRPQVNGVITERTFTQGAQVKKGQQLYNIDDKLFRVALRSAQADVTAEQANVKTLRAKQKRYQDLLTTNAISQQDYDDIEAQLEQALAAVSVAQAEVSLAQVNLDYSKVYAPISGRISRSFFTEGALVTANQSEPLATITQLDPIYVDIQVSSGQVLGMQLALNQRGALPVEVTLVGNLSSATTLMGEVEFSEVVVEESTGTVTLRARLPNPDNLLLPGLFVNTSINQGDVQGLTIPQRAAIRQPNGSLKVWVVDSDNVANLRSIVVGQAIANKWHVLSGLEAGELVVLAGYHKLRPGSVVSAERAQMSQSISASH